MNQDDCSITQSHAYSNQIKSKQLVIHQKKKKKNLTLALLQPWNHKPLLDDCECEQKQKPINLKSSKAYDIYKTIKYKE